MFAESQFVFDLKLPPEFKPRIGDGEVQDFYLLPIDKVCVPDTLLTSTKGITRLALCDCSVLVSGEGASGHGRLQTQLCHGGPGLPHQTLVYRA